jgi:hypothetical protein
VVEMALISLSGVHVPDLVGAPPQLRALEMNISERTGCFGGELKIMAIIYLTDYE